MIFELWSLFFIGMIWFFAPAGFEFLVNRLKEMVAGTAADMERERRALDDNDPSNPPETF